MPLDVREVAAYVSGRIRLAGGVSRALFTREAVMAIHEYSGGIPRVINVICDNVLLSAFATSQSPAPRSLVEEVCRDFDISRQPAGAGDDTGSALADPEPAPGLQEAARQAAAPAAPAAQRRDARRRAGDGTASAAEPASGGRSLFGHFTRKTTVLFF